MTRAITAQLEALDPRDARYATAFVEQLLAAAQARGASDIHLTPRGQALEARWRVDGVLEALGEFSRGEATDVVTRLKVLADLLTYRTETPQEGRIRVPASGAEMRVSTFPTLHGERAVIRIFRETRALLVLADLDLPAPLVAALRRILTVAQGAVLVTGPAGSGKTTTAYACVREVLAAGPLRSVLTLEDPIECVIEGAVQAAIAPAAAFDFATALRSLMRQDPEVILVGEVRDKETAVAAFQAALTGHLVLSTFHAGSACQAMSRLGDMGIEPYVLRSALEGVLSQRLLRRRCACAGSAPGNGLNCPQCGGTGYFGRGAIAEWLPPLEGELGAAVLAAADARQLEALARAAGMQTLSQCAAAAVAEGWTTASEVRRVLGAELIRTDDAADDFDRSP